MRGCEYHHHSLHHGGLYLFASRIRSNTRCQQSNDHGSEAVLLAGQIASKQASSATSNNGDKRSSCCHANANHLNTNARRFLFGIALYETGTRQKTTLSFRYCLTMGGRTFVVVIVVLLLLAAVGDLATLLGSFGNNLVVCHSHETVQA